MTKKNTEIEYLRAIAVGMVIVAHVGYLLPWQRPWFDVMVQHVALGGGVDLFFCISGFVVTRSFIQQFDFHCREGSQWRAALAFYVRRLFRLLPAAWLWIGVFMACSILFNHSGAFTDLATNLKAVFHVVTYSANFAQANGQMGMMGHYWSLALEEQFYFLFPLFLMVVPSQYRWHAVAALIVAHAAIGWSKPVDPIWRINSALWGMLLYFYSKSEAHARLAPRFLSSRTVALLINGALLYLVAAVPILFTTSPRMFSILSLPCATFVLMATYQRGYVAPLKWAHPFLEWMGSRSYGIYLVHIPAFCIVREAMYRTAAIANGIELAAKHTAIAIGLGLMLTAFFAELSFRLIESPLREYGANLAKRILRENIGSEEATTRKSESLSA